MALGSSHPCRARCTAAGITTVGAGVTGAYLLSRNNNNETTVETASTTTESTPSPIPETTSTPQPTDVTPTSATSTSTPTPTTSPRPTNTPTPTTVTSNPGNYTVIVMGTGEVFIQPSLSMDAKSRVTFTLSAQSQKSYFIKITDSYGNVVDSFGLNTEPAAINSVPHATTFNNPGTYTVSAYNCLNTQCISENGSSLDTMRITVK